MSRSRLNRAALKRLAFGLSSFWVAERTRSQWVSPRCDRLIHAACFQRANGGRRQTRCRRRHLFQITQIWSHFSDQRTIPRTCGYCSQVRRYRRCACAHVRDICARREQPGHPSRLFATASRSARLQAQYGPVGRGCSKAWGSIVTKLEHAIIELGVADILRQQEAAQDHAQRQVDLTQHHTPLRDWIEN
jgi:hypothetical protein